MANFNVKSLLEAKNPQAVMLEQTRGLKFQIFEAMDATFLRDIMIE